MTEILEQLRATTFLLEKICKRHNINPELCNGEECCCAQDIIDENKRLINSNGWISVNERLPTKDGDYLVYYVYEDMKPFCSVCEFSTYLNMFDGDHVYITHWQPLPQPPLENENAK